MKLMNRIRNWYFKICFDYVWKYIQYSQAQNKPEIDLLRAIKFEQWFLDALKKQKKHNLKYEKIYANDKLYVNAYNHTQWVACLDWVIKQFNDGKIVLKTMGTHSNIESSKKELTKKNIKKS